MKFVWGVLGVVVLVLVSVAAPEISDAATYRGTVIDAETKAPIEGAVVVVIWYKKPLITMDGPTYLHKVTEALTDAGGKFTVDGSPGMNWNPFRRVLKDPKVDPDIVIFKPGYGSFPVAQVRPALGKQAMLNDGAVVELPKLKTREELMRYHDTGYMGVPTVVPDEQIPNLIRLINVQRSNLGLQSFPGSLEQGQNR